MAQKEDWKRDSRCGKDLGDQEDAMGCPGASTHQHDFMSNPPTPVVIPGWNGSQSLANAALGRVVCKCVRQSSLVKALSLLVRK